MRRLVIFFLLLSFVFTSSNSSMQMFSIEQGSVYTESFNVNHILNSFSVDICNTSKKHNDSLTPNRNYNHSHVILLNLIALDESEFVNSLINPILIIFTYPIQHNLHSSTSANTLLSHSKLNFPHHPIASILQSTTLLI